MQEVDSAALQRVAKVLQLSTGGAEQTDFQDELLQQVLDVAPIIRRGLTVAGSSGIFTATILNTHIGTDIVTTDVNPYSPGTTFVGNAYPPIVDEDLDVWVLAAQAQNITGQGDFGGGFFGTISDATGMGWRNEANAIAMEQIRMVWNQEVQFGHLIYLSDNSGVSLMSHFGAQPFRVSHGANTRLRFDTKKIGAGAATFKLFLTLGVFPAGMGQDGG